MFLCIDAGVAGGVNTVVTHGHSGHGGIRMVLSRGRWGEGGWSRVASLSVEHWRCRLFVVPSSVYLSGQVVENVVSGHNLYEVEDINIKKFMRSGCWGRVFLCGFPTSTFCHRK